MSKFYAVKVGRNPGIYTTWSECEAQVKGFSGAQYKSFPKKQDAEIFIGIANDMSNIPSNTVFFQKKVEKKEKEEKEEKGEKTIEIYTDGSHKKVEGGYKGFGAYCQYEGKEYRFSSELSDEILREYGINRENSSNPTLEFLAFTEVLKMIIESEVIGKSFIFYIDYIGVSNWINGMWKARELHIKKIKEKADLYLGKLQNRKNQIVIKHVPGHSGVAGNEEADQAAKDHQNYNNFPELFQIVK